LEFAQQRLRDLETASARGKAQEELRVACHREDSIALSLAIESGMAAGLADFELEQARRALCGFQAKSKAREQLRQAEVASSVGYADAHSSLEAALRSAEAAGLSDEELTRPRTTLQRIQAPPTIAQVQLPVSSSFACTTMVGPTADCQGMSSSREAPPMQACPSWSLAGSEAPSTNLLMPATANAVAPACPSWNLVGSEAPSTNLLMPGTATAVAPACPSWNLAGSEAPSTNLLMPGTATAVAPATLPATSPQLSEAALQAYPPWGAPAGVAPDTTPGLPTTAPRLPDTAPQLPGTVPQVPTTEPQIPGTNPQAPLTDPKGGGWGSWLGLYKL